MSEPSLETGPAVEPMPAPIRWEMAVVLLVGVVSPLASSIASYCWPEYQKSGAGTSFALREFVGLEHALLVGVVMLYVLYRSGEPWSLWGIRRPKWYDLPVGIVIWLMSWFFGDLIGRTLVVHFGSDWQDFYEFPTLDRSSWVDQTLLVAFSCANGFAEEVVMRGYLIPRFERLLRSTGAAVVATSALFAGYHLYQGLMSTATIFAIGLVFGLSFVALRRLWPLAIAHALADYFVPWLNTME